MRAFSKTVAAAAILLAKSALAFESGAKIEVPSRRTSAGGSCNHIALALPLTGIRFDSGAHVTGPIKPLGLGLGWAHVFGPCGGRIAPAFNLYGFSETLDFENDYQLAIGGTVGVRLLSSVVLGVGLQYDLVRATHGSDGARHQSGVVPGIANGDRADHRSVTWVLMAHWLF
jgi:hypothetical protein